MAKIFTADNFQTEVLELSKTKPVLVDFFAHWCGPCQEQGPIVEEVAELMADKAVAGKLDVMVQSIFVILLKSLHPFMPFVTEEIYQHMPGHNASLMVEAWPSSVRAARSKSA
jgi:thiol-disulfide isomerase/thioredoxin